MLTGTTLSPSITEVLHEYADKTDMRAPFLFIFFLPLFVFASDFSNSRCLESISSYFKQDVDQVTMDKFLSIQARLTMNKLARANLVQSKETDTKDIEKNILHLLKAKHDGDPKLKDTLDFFESQPLSRKALSQVIPLYADILKAQYGENHPYILTSSDIKMLEILGENEIVHSSGKQDSRQFSGRLSNLSSLINSSYRKVIDKKLIEKNIESLQAQIVSSQNSIYKLLEKIPIPEACSTAVFKNGCIINQSQTNFADLYFNVSEIQIIMNEALYSLVSEKDLLRTSGFGQLWPKVILDADKNVPQIIPLRRALVLHFKPEIIEIQPILTPKLMPIASRISVSTPLVLKIEKLSNEDKDAKKNKLATWDYTVTQDDKKIVIPGTNTIPDKEELGSAIGITNKIKDLLDTDQNVNYFKLKDQNDIYVVEVKPDHINEGAHMIVRISQNEDRTLPDYIEYLTIETSKGEYLSRPYKTLDEKICDYNQECSRMNQLLGEFESENKSEEYFDQFIIDDYIETYSKEFNKSVETKELKQKLENEFQSIKNKKLTGKKLQEALEEAGKKAFGDEYDMNSGDIFAKIKKDIDQANLSEEEETKQVDQLLERFEVITSYKSKIKDLAKYKKDIIETSCHMKRASGEFTNYCRLLAAKNEKIQILRSGFETLDPNKKGFPLDGYSRY